jgi:hypothetical protein
MRVLALAKREQKKRNIRQSKSIYLHKARAPQSGHLKGCVCGEAH